MTEIILYKIITENKLEKYYENFKKTVYKILTDPNGWESHPNAYNGKYVKFSYVQNGFDENCINNHCVKIHLVKNQTVKKICKFDNLSCYDGNTRDIYINLNKWLYGSKQFFNDNPKSTIKDYREYVINHEMGHHLGRGHKKICDKNTNKAFIMIQQTLGNRGCKSNTKPLHNE